MSLDANLSFYKVRANEKIAALLSDDVSYDYQDVKPKIKVFHNKYTGTKAPCGAIRAQGFPGGQSGFPDSSMGFPDHSMGYPDMPSTDPMDWTSDDEFTDYSMPDYSIDYSIDYSKAYGYTENGECICPDLVPIDYSYSYSYEYSYSQDYSEDYSYSMSYSEDYSQDYSYSMSYSYDYS
jgi:hypothetical protein